MVTGEDGPGIDFGTRRRERAAAGDGALRIHGASPEVRPAGVEFIESGVRERPATHGYPGMHDRKMRFQAPYRFRIVG